MSKTKKKEKEKQKQKQKQGPAPAPTLPPDDLRAASDAYAAARKALPAPPDKLVAAMAAAVAAEEAAKLTVKGVPGAHDHWMAIHHAGPLQPDPAAQVAAAPPKIRRVLKIRLAAQAAKRAAQAAVDQFNKEAWDQASPEVRDAIQATEEAWQSADRLATETARLAETIARLNREAAGHAQVPARIQSAVGRLTVPGGRDQFTKMNRSELLALLPGVVLPAHTRHTDECLRWMCRGLDRLLAVHRGEVSQARAAKHRKRWAAGERTPLQRELEERRDHGMEG